MAVYVRTHKHTNTLAHLSSLLLTHTDTHNLPLYLSISLTLRHGQTHTHTHSLYLTLTHGHIHTHTHNKHTLSNEWLLEKNSDLLLSEKSSSLFPFLCEIQSIWSGDSYGRCAMKKLWRKYTTFVKELWRKKTRKMSVKIVVKWLFCDILKIKIVSTEPQRFVFKMFSRRVIIRLVALIAILRSSDCSEFLHRVPRQNFDDPFNIQGVSGATGSSSSFNSNPAQQVRNCLNGLIDILPSCYIHRAWILLHHSH